MIPPEGRCPSLVIDSNVFVAAGFNPQSTSARIIDGARRGVWRVVWDRDTRAETRAVLSQIPGVRWSEVVAIFREPDEYTGDTHPERYNIVSDPDDRKFVALADAAGAILVTNDDHLLAVRERLDVPVLAPQEFIGRYG